MPRKPQQPRSAIQHPKPGAPPNPVLMTAGIGAWYNRGVERLRGTLIGHPVDVQAWVDEWPPGDFPRDCIYTAKAAAFNYAIQSGYRTLIWADASITVRKPIQPFLDAVRAKGYWLGTSGHNAAQTCSDACLSYFGVTRDEAEGIPDSATGLFGMCLDHPQAAKFVELFIKAGRDGAFHGSRKHAGQSSDPRFLFSRQDQSAATIIANKVGLTLSPWQEFCRFRWDINRLDTIFHCEGM